MPTYYDSINTPVVPRINRNVRQSNLAHRGLIMLHRNSNYSNTMHPCIYICKRDKIRWM